MSPAPAGDIDLDLNFILTRIETLLFFDSVLHDTISMALYESQTNIAGEDGYGEYTSNDVRFPPG